jgi:hypothetical protein
MKKTLQDQYLLIKEGKGHKGVFLADAKRDFPQYVPNAATFEEAAASLKTKNIINENIINVMPINYIEPTKKQPYELAFESFLSEAKKKKENEDEKVKAEEKKVSKPVEKDLEKQFDNKDDKNPDNLIFDQIMMGYYTEMKDPKNADKTMQQLKDMVIKNLSKDPIHYTKDGQFGVKGLGYTTESPGLGEPKEAKGKWKSSGYGDLKESKINEAYEPDINAMDELDLKSKLHSMGVTPIVVNSMLSTKGVEGLRDALKDKLKDRAIGFKESKEIDSFISNVKKAFTEKPDKKFTPEEIEAKLNQLYPGRAERKKDNSPEETKLREIIREMVDAELGEATQMSTIINPKKVNKDREERDPSNKYLTFDKDFEKIQKSEGNLIVKTGDDGEDKIFITKVLHANLGPKAGNADLRKHLMDRANIETAILGGKPVFKIKGAKINSKGNISVFVPVEKSLKDLKEGVEKELAAINKEAEHEILQSKLNKVQDLIDKKQSQISKLDEDEDMKALTDAKKVKEIEKDIKALEKAKSKIDKMMGKHKGKKKEVIDETEDELDKMSPEDLDNLESWEQNSDIGQGEELDIEEEY